jgi:hypothetical protein
MAPDGHKTCKRCKTHRPKEQFAEKGEVCYPCKRASAFKREERKLIAQVEFYQRKLDEHRREYGRRIALGES